MQLYTKLHTENRIFYSSVLWCAYPPKMRPLLMQLPPPDALWHCLLWFGMLFAFWDMRTSTYCFFPYPYKMSPSADVDASWCKEFFGWDAFCFWDIRSSKRSVFLILTKCFLMQRHLWHCLLWFWFGCFCDICAFEILEQACECYGAFER